MTSECWCGIPHEYLDFDIESGEMFDRRDVEEVEECDMCIPECAVCPLDREPFCRREGAPS